MELNLEELRKQEAARHGRTMELIADLDAAFAKLQRLTGFPADKPPRVGHNETRKPRRAKPIPPAKRPPKGKQINEAAAPKAPSGAAARVAAAIAEFNGEWFSLVELSAKLKMAAPACCYHLKKLARAGQLETRYGGPRGRTFRAVGKSTQLPPAALPTQAAEEQPAKPAVPTVKALVEEFVASVAPPRFTRDQLAAHVASKRRDFSNDLAMQANIHLEALVDAKKLTSSGPVRSRMTIYSKT